MSALHKEQKLYESINGVQLPVSEIGISVRRLTQYPDVWAIGASERLIGGNLCKRKLIKSCQNLSQQFQQTAAQLGFTSRVSYGTAVKLLIGEKEAAVAMEAQLPVEFRDYGQYFTTLANALAPSDNVRDEQPSEMPKSAGVSGSYAVVARRRDEQPSEMPGSAGVSESYAVVARRAFADKPSGKDKKAGRRDDGVEVTLGPFPGGTKWYQVKGLLGFGNVSPSHVALAVNPNGSMLAYANYLDRESAQAAVTAMDGLTVGNVGPLHVQLASPEKARRSAVLVPNDDGPPTWTLAPDTEYVRRAYVPMSCFTNYSPSDVAAIEWYDDGSMYVDKAEPGTYLEADEADA